MKTQHTPGPWTIHADTDGWPLVMSGGVAGRIVANVNPQSCPDESSAPEFVEMPCEANARLIAAAPELLEAVVAAELMLRHAAMTIEWEVGNCRSEEAMEASKAWPLEVYTARAAIAKATGSEA